jgi:formate/nitrite transporter FocA (FNT family)
MIKDAVRRVDASFMRWKSLLGWVLVVMGALGLFRLLANFQADSYTVGNLVGGVLFVLVGVWLIHAGRPAAQS